MKAITNRIAVYLRRRSEIIAKLRMKWRKWVSRSKLAAWSFQSLELICLICLRTLNLHDAISCALHLSSRERVNLDGITRSNPNIIPPAGISWLSIDSTQLLSRALIDFSLEDVWWRIHWADSKLNVLPHSKCFARSNLSIHSVYTVQKRILFEILKTIPFSL